MLAQPSMIKRPVLELGGGKILVGFKPEEYGGTRLIVMAGLGPAILPSLTCAIRRGCPAQGRA